jgi:hypothetical protein
MFFEKKRKVIVFLGIKERINGEKANILTSNKQKGTK